MVRPVSPQEIVSTQTAAQEKRRQKPSVDTTKQHEKTGRKMAETAFAEIQQIQRNDKGKKMSSPERLTVTKTSWARQKETWAARLSSTFASPPCIEKMRCKNETGLNLLFCFYKCKSIIVLKLNHTKLIQ